MKGILKVLFFTLLPFVVWSQKYDTISVKKNIASLRDSILPDEIVKKWSSIFITEDMDTLTRDFRFRYRSGIGVIIEEINCINGRLNGISPTYHTNGNIFSMTYFVDDKPWEAIYLADSSGRRYFPGTLTNGFGTQNWIDVAGNDGGFATYKNGNMEGEYCKIDGSAKRGKLIYREDLIKYDTITVITFIDENRDTMICLLTNGKASDNISKNFLTGKKAGKIQALKEKEVVSSYSGLHKELDIFLQPGVFPVGEWRWYDPKKNETYVVFKFSEIGKLEKWTNYALKLVTEFNENGSIRTEYELKD